MRYQARINLPALHAEFQAWQMLPMSLRGGRFQPEVIEPRPEWHGRQCEVLAHGVFRFEDDAERQYHLINPVHLVALT